MFASFPPFNPNNPVTLPSGSTLRRAQAAARRKQRKVSIEGLSIISKKVSLFEVYRRGFLEI